jgi:hypothetical protein
MSSFTITQEGTRYTFKIRPGFPSGNAYRLVQGRDEREVARFQLGDPVFARNRPTMKEASRRAARQAIAYGEAEPQKRRRRR